MDVRLTYADESVAVTVPERVQVRQYGLSATREPASYDDFVRAFERVGGKRICEDPMPLIVVNDGHRGTPTPAILEWLDRYDGRLIDTSRFLVACGTHDEPSPKHYETIFGRYLDRIRGHCAWHDCNDRAQMAKIGVDRFGQDVLVNSRAVQAAKVLVITSVEPHYFAGFTGGRKSVLPGLADRATIERNHNLANSLDCCPLRIKGNPMVEHLDEMLRMFGPEKVFSIQVVTDDRQRVLHVFCGRIDRVFPNAVEASYQVYANEVAETYDLILAEVRPPLDRTLYQIQKALENCQTACADGGTVVVLAACRDGIGKRGFYDLAQMWDKERNRPTDGAPHFGSHKLSRVNAMTRRINVRLYSQLPDDQPRQVFYEPVHDLQKLVDQCLDKSNRKRLAVVRDAGHTVLKLAGAA